MSGHRALTDNYLADTTVEDPGSGGTISIDRNPAVVELVSVAADAGRTLADPVQSGIFLVLTYKTHVANLDVTATTDFNQNNDNVVQFRVGGETVLLVSVPDPDSSGDYCWRIFGPYPEADGPAVA
jgi:hypothetical protein